MRRKRWWFVRYLALHFSTCNISTFCHFSKPRDCHCICSGVNVLPFQFLLPSLTTPETPAVKPLITISIIVKVYDNLFTCLLQTAINHRYWFGLPPYPYPNFYTANVTVPGMKSCYIANQLIGYSTSSTLNVWQHCNIEFLGKMQHLMQLVKRCDK